MIVPYSHKSHYEMVKSWLAYRKMAPPEQRLFSTTGFVVDDTAIGFLMCTNSRQFYIDHIVANPKRSKSDRDKALRFLFKALEETAREAGALLVVVLANLPTMTRRISEMGYTKGGEYSLFFKQLGMK